MELAPGAEFDRYRVDSVLGEGGTATVFLVTHRTLKTQRALKVLHVANKRLAERLTQEALILSTIEHRNIVRIIDALDVDGSPAVLMEYVNGPPLDRYLLDSPPSLATAEGIFLGILDGVERAHNAGIVHRDLKPANVLLAMENGRPVPKVADFGIARVFGDTEGQRMTKTGSAMGTPSYMAPEQIMDAAGVDQRADIFALGCILYELVTGRLAFEGVNFMATFDTIRAGTYTPPEELVPDLPDRFSSTIRSCLYGDRDRRLTSCAEIRAKLSGAGATVVPAETVGIGSPSASAQPPAPPRAAPPRAPTRPSSETFALGIDAPPQPTVDLEPRAPASSFTPGRIAGAVALLALLGMGGWAISGGSGRPSPELTGEISALPPGPAVVTPAPQPPTPAPPAPAATTADVGQPTTVAPVAPQPVVATPKPAAKATVTKPVVAEPVSAAVPEPVAAPKPVAAVTGRISVTGAGSYTIKDGAGGSVRGSVPPGHYTVTASWGDRSVKVPVDIEGGDTVTVACDEGFGECAVK